MLIQPWQQQPGRLSQCRGKREEFAPDLGVHISGLSQVTLASRLRATPPGLSTALAATPRRGPWHLLSRLPPPHRGESSPISKRRGGRDGRHKHQLFQSRIASGTFSLSLQSALHLSIARLVHYRSQAMSIHLLRDTPERLRLQVQTVRSEGQALRRRRTRVVTPGLR